MLSTNEHSSRPQHLTHVRERREDERTRYRAEQALANGAILVERFLADLEALADAGPVDLPWVTTEDVASLFDVRPATVRTWCTAGKLQDAIKLDNGVWRIPVAAVDAFTASRSNAGSGS